ncbi:MAG: hypothetical protein K2X93_04885 [Candidatus Obscuribacterales bacterium]|nr:hypothetical protein [Candidatus Obscuribacterales bacterium]
MRLEAQVEHSEYQQPLDDFKVGSALDESLLPTGQDGQGNWWRVPGWLAGQWQKTGRITVLSFKDLATNEEVPGPKHVKVHYPDNEVLGHQTDCHGDIWTYVPIPYVVRTISGGRTNVNIVNAFDEVEADDDSVTLRIFTVTLVVDNATSKVISVCQRESLQTLTAVNESKMEIVDSTKFFDRDGKAIYSKKLLTHSQRLGRFSPTHFLDRSTNRPLPWRASYKLPRDLRDSAYVPLDLRDSFASFLRSHNLTALIPET